VVKYNEALKEIKRLNLYKNNDIHRYRPLI